MDKINEALFSAVKKLFNIELSADLTIVDSKFGDYASSIAMRIASQQNINPKEVAEQLCVELNSLELFHCEPAGPGFINFRLNHRYWTEELDKALKLGDKFGNNQIYKSKKIVVEYSDPNPFKLLHAGHLYTSVIGDAISNLFENAGAKVYRVNFGGDIGLHTAKTIYSIILEFDGENPEKLSEIDQAGQNEWLSKHYINGNNIYEDDEPARDGIQNLNKRLYAISQKGEEESALAQIYWQTRDWSYKYLKDFYARIGSHFDKYYPESETAILGMLIVKDGLKTGVFKESEGAIVFEGENHGLHTRVFVNSQGLPTYETKDLGLMQAKKRDYNPDLSVVITGNEQAEYMKVVLSAMQKIDASLATRTKHITHGLVKLKDGQKMSSRKGNILVADEVINSATKANQEINKQDEPAVVLGAIRYSFIKPRIGADIIFDPLESINLHGNSGPYIQYAHARARSILSKSKNHNNEVELLDDSELDLAKKVLAFPEVLEKAVNEVLPNQICTYLYELAHEFNRFYEQNRVLGDEREAIRLKIVKAYQQTIKNGLNILNIEAPNTLA